MKRNVELDFNELHKKFRSGGQKGLYQWGKKVGKESSAQCPHDRGDLRRTLSVIVEDNEVDISYNSDYAVYVHEMDLNFQRGKKNKYLEDPFKDNAKDLEAILAKNIKI